MDPSASWSTAGCTLDPTINGLKCVGSHITPAPPFPGGAAQSERIVIFSFPRYSELTIPIWITVSGQVYTDSTTPVSIMIDIADLAGNVTIENVAAAPVLFIAHGFSGNMIPNDSADYWTSRGIFIDFTYPTDTVLHVKNFKLEQGYVDYPKWTPAYEDVEKITEAEIDQLLSKIGA